MMYEDEGHYVTSAEVVELGICADNIPEPVVCEFCGKKLYYEAAVLWGDSFAESQVIWWSNEPDECDCESAQIAALKRQVMAADKREEARHNEITSSLRELCGIKKRFWERTFDNFIADTPGRKMAYSAGIDYAHTFDDKAASGIGLYIEGTYGTGKTHLAAAIGLSLIEQEKSVIMLTSFDLLDKIKQSFDNDGLSEQEITRRYKTCDLLIIDDLGKEQCTEWSMSILYSIINERYEAMKPIIITTNFSADDLIKILTPKGSGNQKAAAIISRLKEMSRTVTMAWEDWRGRK